MAISQSQAEHFINRTKNSYLSVLTHIQAVEAVALMNEQEVAAWGGGAAITAAIPSENWDAAQPFTKEEFHDILANIAALKDLMGNHGDLKTNLVKLRE